MKSWLHDNDIDVNNEETSVVAERFTRTLKNKPYKYMTSISKMCHIDKIDNIFNKYNNTYHSTITMRPVDVKSSTYQKLSIKILNLKLNLKYKNIFSKVYTTN